MSYETVVNPSDDEATNKAPGVMPPVNETGSVRRNERKRLPLNNFSIREGGFAYPEIDATLPMGHTYEDTLEPEYWALHAVKMTKPQFSVGPDWSGAVIHVRTLDHAFYAQLYVRAVRGTEVVVSPIGEPTYFGPKSVETGGYFIRWNVGARSWEILRKSDNEIVARKLATKEDAQSWIEQAKKAA